MNALRGPIRAMAIALLGALAACTAAVAWAQAGNPGGAVLAFQRPGQAAQLWRWSPGTRSYAAMGESEAGAKPQIIELGSLWKLVVWRAMVEQHQTDRPLQCTGASREEVYCCNPGQSISRDDALARSCGLYFSPPHTDTARLLQDAVRMTLQRPDSGDSWPPALLKAMRTSTLGPSTRVPLQEWLDWLSHWPVALRRQAQDALLAYWLEGPGQDQLGAVGSRLRAKTFTLERKDGTRYGGASGWTQSGQAFWLGARGSSTLVLGQSAAPAADVMERAIPGTADLAGVATALLRDDDECIDVRFFARYPVRDITPPPAGDSVPGPARISFANGNHVDVPAQAKLRAMREGDAWRVSGRMSLDEYVARVVDREGAAEPAQAARALAVAARSYVLARAERSGGCWQIADSSATQRVAPRPATAAARAATWSTAGFLLEAPAGTLPGQYHATQAAPGVMSWQDAVARAQRGQGFNALLAQAYPESKLVTANAHLRAGCAAMPQVQSWLDRQMAQWRPLLVMQPGYRHPGPVRVCQLQQGRPHAAQASNSIYVQGIASVQDRAGVAHEFLHLAFARHPRGQDEAFIESLARQLLGVQ
jgi:uncharacterized protein YfaQ (DUF2300 family)